MATSQLFLSPFVAKAVKDKKANGRPKAAGGPKQQATYGICHKWAVNEPCPTQCANSYMDANPVALVQVGLM